MFPRGTRRILSRQRSRVRVPSSPPFLQGMALHDFRPSRAFPYKFSDSVHNNCWIRILGEEIRVQLANQHGLLIECAPIPWSRDLYPTPHQRCQFTDPCNTIQCVDSSMHPHENHLLFGCTRPKPSHGNVPAGLALASGFGLCFQRQGVQAECCVDPLIPLRLPDTSDKVPDARFCSGGRLSNHYSNFAHTT
jgi:hypothetical protein